MRLSSNFYKFYFAWVISCLSLVVSLYFSEFKHLTPCHLCWYQRICLFPLTIILGIGTFQRFIGIVPYVLPQVGLGIFFAGYQVLIQEVIHANVLPLCGSGASCLEKIDIGFGPVTPPMLSLFGFCLIAYLLFSSWKDSKKSIL
ncbi:MAG: disulfide bond formation protein B [Rhabdochlamydiaceae bacterium]